MKIKELIKAFKFLLPIYEKELQLTEAEDRNPDLSLGLCFALDQLYKPKPRRRLFDNIMALIDLKKSMRKFYANIFTFKAFYDDVPHYLCSVGKRHKNHKNYIKKCIKPRVEFLKDEIQYLEYLIYQGYTDI